MAKDARSPLMLLRLKAGLSQKELAQLLGVERNTVSRWELGQSEARLTLKQFKALCKALNVTVDELPDSFAPEVSDRPDGGED